MKDCFNFNRFPWDWLRIQFTFRRMSFALWTDNRTRSTAEEANYLKTLPVAAAKWLGKRRCTWQRHHRTALGGNRGPITSYSNRTLRKVSLSFSNVHYLSSNRQKSIITIHWKLRNRALNGGGSSACNCSGWKRSRSRHWVTSNQR